MKFLNKLAEYFAEFLGTLLFFLVIFMSALFGGTIGSFAIGFGLGAIVLAFGKYGEAHFNPAITIAMAVKHLVQRRKPVTQVLVDGVSYLFAQFLGGLVAFNLASWVRESIIDIQLASYNAGNTTGVEATRDQVAEQFSKLSTNFLEGAVSLTFILEMVLAFVLVYTFISVMSNERIKHLGGIIVGFVLFTITSFSNQITGASFNPMRSLIPALYEQGTALADVWVYILAPILGGLLATAVYLVLEGLSSKGTKEVIAPVKNTASRGGKAKSTTKRKTTSRKKK